MSSNVVPVQYGDKYPHNAPETGGNIFLVKPIIGAAKAP